jgi:hypothetical protein
MGFPAEPGILGGFYLHNSEADEAQIRTWSMVSIRGILNRCRA